MNECTTTLMTSGWSWDRSSSSSNSSTIMSANSFAEAPRPMMVVLSLTSSAYGIAVIEPAEVGIVTGRSSMRRSSR